VRKRILNISFAILGLAALAFTLMQPRKGSVEYHVREYRVLAEQIKKGTRTERAFNIVNRVLGRNRYVGVKIDHYEQLEEHRRALVGLGYLEQREFVLSNRSIHDVTRALNESIRTHPRWQGDAPEFFQIITDKTNAITVLGRPEDMADSAEAIQKADVPER
jgi:hypothetical protein